ncbi:MAG: O-antigen ligase family protein [Lachnospiraceae bacterium]|nr:O-antigen ligase family protein [Lachnospiraceae bacterium]
MKRKKQNKTKFLNGNYALLPTLFVLCVVPLIMRLYIYYTGLSVFPWRSDNSKEVDIFLYYKSIALIVSAVIMIFILVFSIYKDSKKRGLNENLTKLKQAKWIIPVAVFGFLALLSTLFSKYRSFGFSGFLEQFESIWVILAYCIVAIYTFYFTRTKEDINTLRKGLFIFLTIICAIGFSQLMGHDFWETGLGKSIFVPHEYDHLKDSLEFEMSGSGNHQVYLTLLNPNYVGVFAALILPICIMCCIGGDSLSKKIAWGLMSAALFLCTLGSGSKAFLLALAVVASIGVLLFVIRNIKVLPIITAIISTFVILASAYGTYINIDIFDYVKNALTPKENSYVVEDFVIEPNKVTLKYAGKEISFNASYNSFGGVFLFATDESGTNINNTIDDNGIIRFEDERFKDIYCKTYGQTNNLPFVIEINAAGHTYRFSYIDSGYTYVNNIFKPDTIVHAESAVFTKYDRLFSGRGYIWSRSIPLLKGSIILGSGADTFGVVFPHNDYIARTNAGYQNLFTTKPHCMYLQSAIQYGIPALICYLTFVIMYILQTFKLCWKTSFKDSHSCFALGIMLGIIGYCIMGISNDSCVAVTPVAWTILGIGYALNHIIKKEKTQS